MSNDEVEEEIKKPAVGRGLHNTVKQFSFN